MNTAIGLLWLIYHYNAENTLDDFTTVPSSLYLFGVMLTCLSLWPYMTNSALRAFTIKTTKIKLHNLKFNSLLKAQPSHQVNPMDPHVKVISKHNKRTKSQSQINLSAEKNLNRVRVSTESCRRRDCIEMMSKNSSTLIKIDI